MSPRAAATAVGAAARAPALRRAVGIAAFAALTAVSARIAVPVPGSAVPFTLQPVAVLLAGFLLGAGAGAASQALYVALGLAGLPVFAAGGGAAYLLGPTAGYLLAFPLGAAIAGLFAREEAGFFRLLAGGCVGLAAVHAGGVAWLSVLTDPGTAMEAGARPFLVGDLLKVGLAVLLTIRLRGPTRRLFA